MFRDDLSELPFEVLKRVLYGTRGCVFLFSSKTILVDNNCASLFCKTVNDTATGVFGDNVR